MKLVQVGAFALLVAFGCGGGGEEARLQAEADAARQAEELRQLQAAPPPAPPAPEPLIAVAPEPEPAASAAPAAPAAPAVTAGTWEGDITRASGGVVVVDVASDPPAVGAKGTLSKKIDQKFGGMSISAWLVIADVVVESSAPGAVGVKVVQEQSVTEINGKKVDHFAPGGHVKLEVP